MEMEVYFIHKYFFHVVAFLVVSLIFMTTENKLGFPTALTAALLYYLVYNKRQDLAIIQEMSIGGWEKVKWSHRIKYNRSPDVFAWLWPLWVVMIILMSLFILLFDRPPKK